jgi:hypothetical protein
MWENRGMDMEDLDMGEFLDRGVYLHIIVMTMMMMVWGYIWH